MTDAVKLDHVGVAIRDLDRGRAAYERLGFTLTPRSIHRGSPSPGAAVIPFGSGNHCAMFRDGYLEIVGLTDPAIYSNIKSLVARYEGAHIVAFGVDSADAACETLKQRGIAVEGVRKLERDAAYGPDGRETRKAAFRNLYFDLAAYPEARMIFIEHLTPDVLWQPQLLDHANGAVAIRDVFYCVADAQAAADKYAALFGIDAKSTADGEWRIALDRGNVWIATPEAWARRAPDAAVPALPSPAGIGFAVKDLAATRARLVKNGLEPRDGPEGAVWVAPEHACGAAILFYQE
jgi:catechol 2,3-dioxygenase-like lactoylglutathione lyase family enzyme